MTSYYLANVFQAKIHQNMQVGSILGGGEIEGLMLQDPTRNISVKLVDRLTFTIRNNESRLARLPKSFDQFPSPFDQVFTDNSIFYPIKGQPFHIGHVLAITEVALSNPDRTIHVLASMKQPNLAAENWKQLEASDSKKRTKNGDFDYVFSAELRKQLIQLATFPENVQIHFCPPNLIWNHIALLSRQITSNQQSPIKYQIAMGRKEAVQNRYDEILKLFEDVVTPYYVDPQCNGISGTSVRTSIMELVSDPLSVSERQKLHGALSFVEDNATRESFIEQLIEEYRALMTVAEKL